MFVSLPGVDVDLLEAAIKERVVRVQEIQRLALSAEEQGLRLYMMGGSASSLAHYVALDLLREQGKTDLVSSRFQYFWDQIFHHSQDLDLAIRRIDDKPETYDDFVTIEFLSREIFPHLKIDIFGFKSERELRPALENKASDLYRQHTDSISNGLIELTSHREIKDLREGHLFLKSIAQRKIAYLFSGFHSSTERAKKGINPPFLSALRFYINAIRYDLEICPIDRVQVNRIIDSTSSSASREPYVQRWIEWNARKLVTQAFDLERAFREIKIKSKLADKLQSLLEDKAEWSTSWHLSRRPLTEKPEDIESSGRPTGKTAQDLNLDIVTHEARSLDSFRQITWSPLGKPNAFISIASEGQAAAFGPGFYTKIGQWGAGNGQGYHIRFRIAPSAREGVDFKVIDDVVLVFNKNILTYLDLDGDIGLNAFTSVFRNSIDNPKYRFFAAHLAKRLSRTQLSSEELNLIIQNCEDILRSHGLLAATRFLLSLNHESLIGFASHFMKDIIREFESRGKSITQLRLELQSRLVYFPSTKWNSNRVKALGRGCLYGVLPCVVGSGAVSVIEASLNQYSYDSAVMLYLYTFLVGTSGLVLSGLGAKKADSEARELRHINKAIKLLSEIEQKASIASRYPRLDHSDGCRSLMAQLKEDQLDLIKASSL